MKSEIELFYKLKHFQTALTKKCVIMRFIQKLLLLQIKKCPRGRSLNMLNENPADR